MKRIIVIIGVLGCAFFAYTNFSQVNTRAEYIDSCLYLMDTRGQKDDCYSVYPEDHSRNAIIWGIVSSVGVIVFISIFITNKPDHLQTDHH